MGSNADLLQGTLDLLILRILAVGAMNAGGVNGKRGAMILDKLREWTTQLRFFFSRREAARGR